MWQLLASVRGEGTQGLPCHNDPGPGWREPFQPYPEMVTSLFLLDEFDEGAGSTFVCPATHHMCRRPRLADAEDRALIQRLAVPVVARAGSIVMWDARLWHGSLPRSTCGERAVLSYAASRVHQKLSDDHSQLSAETLARNGLAFARMVGRNTGYGEGGATGGVLAGGAREGARTTKWQQEEESTSELDPFTRMQSHR